MNVVWILKEAVLAIHGRQIAEHGGSDGLRDEGLLLSALARPGNFLEYGEDVDIAALGASYAYGIAKNHPFIDGNKRTALVVMRTFLASNDIDFVASREEKYRAFLELPEGKLSEEDLSNWIRKHIAD